jgi:hypothetical protein
LREDELAGPARAAHVAQMTGKDKEREERLAAALRENLKRRKAQARAQDEDGQGDKSE